MEIRAMLRRIPMLSYVPDNEMTRLASVAFRRHLRRREPLYLEGEGPAGFYLVEAGWLKATRCSPSGKEVLLDVLGPGEVVGCCCGAVAGPHACSAQALTAAKVVWVRGPTWQSLLRESPHLRQAIAESMLATRRRCVDLAVGLAVQDVEGRLAGLLLKLAKLTESPEKNTDDLGQLLSQQEMAEAIGTAREVVTRHLSKLVERGVLKRRGRKIVIDRPEELRQIAQSA